MKLILLTTLVAQASTESCAGANCAETATLLQGKRLLGGVASLSNQWSKEPPQDATDSFGTVQCLSGVEETDVDFSQSHTVHLRLIMPLQNCPPQHAPPECSDLRQWIFQNGNGRGAEHWLWLPTGKYSTDDGKTYHNHIQFGTHGGVVLDRDENGNVALDADGNEIQIQSGQIGSFAASDTMRTDMLSAKSLTATYDSSGEYKLYMNGELKNSRGDIKFGPQADDDKLYLGVIPGASTVATQNGQSRFTGCILKVEIFNRVLDLGEVQALAADLGTTSDTASETIADTTSASSGPDTTSAP